MNAAVSSIEQDAGDTLDEAVDLVFTWVDGHDPEWLKLKRSFMSVEQAALAADDENLSDDKRYRNMEAICYAVRAANLYAPWLRTIYIVITDGQKLPVSVLATPNVVVVPYSTIMPAAILPSFCSTSIEAHLHNIPGLSEVFLNGDDDYFFWKPTPKSYFITSTGQLRLRGYYQPQILARLGVRRKGHMRMANRSAMLLYERGFEMIYMPEHSFHVFRKSTCRHVWAELHAELTESSALKFRDDNRCLIWQVLVNAYEDHLHEPVHELSLTSHLSFHDVERSKLISAYVLARLLLVSRFPPYTICFNTIPPSWYAMMHRYFSMHLGQTPRAKDVLRVLRKAADPETGDDQRLISNR